MLQFESGFRVYTPLLLNWIAYEHLVEIGDFPLSRLRVVSHICELLRSLGDGTAFHIPSCNRSTEMVRSRSDGEICQYNLIRISGCHCWASEITRSNLFFANLKLKISAVVSFIPLEFGIVADELLCLGIGAGDCAAKSTACNCSASKFSTDSIGACFGIVMCFVKPDEIADPVCMAVSGKENVVVNFIVIQMFECSVSVGHIALNSLVISLFQLFRTIRAYCDVHPIDLRCKDFQMCRTTK
jgi:hypothetical protein